MSFPTSQDPDYVGNQRHRATTPEGLQLARDLAAQIMSEIPAEWLPEGHETQIGHLSELADPSVARAQCSDVSRGLHNWIQHDGFRAEVQVVQALPEPGPHLVCHYALLATVGNGETVIIDFTYAQIDPAAPFPYIAAPAEWVQNVMAAAA